MTATIAYTHGRFEPLHNGHFAVFKNILEKYEKLWIGIANPERIIPNSFASLPRELKESVMAARSPENNPYSYTERQEMIMGSLEAEGVDLNRIRVLPHHSFYDSPNWKDFMPPREDSVIILPAKDTHHYSKVEVYQKEGYKIEMVPLIPGISGKIFDAAWPDGNWRELVPKGAIKTLESKL